MKMSVDAGKATLNREYSRIVAFISRLIIDDIIMAVQLQNFSEPPDTEIKCPSRKPEICKENTLLLGRIEGICMRGQTLVADVICVLKFENWTQMIPICFHSPWPASMFLSSMVVEFQEWAAKTI